jgi:phospholipase C
MASGIHKIQHVVIIMQENRSFDSYFGTYPGADGIPMQNGVPTVCNPDPRRSSASSSTTTAPTGTAAAPTSAPTPAPTSTGARWTASCAARRRGGAAA